eukprot:Gb_32960 [translate_table: standard]
MEEEDEFGDLYADVGLENSSYNAPNPAPLRSQAVYEDYDDEELLYGKPSPSSLQRVSRTPMLSQQVTRAGVEVEFDFGENDEEDRVQNGREEVEVEFDFVEHDEGTKLRDGPKDAGDNEQGRTKEMSEIEWNYSEKEVVDHVVTSPHADFVGSSEIRKEDIGGELVEENEEKPLSYGLGKTKLEEKVEKDLSLTSAKHRDNVFQNGVDNSTLQLDDIPGIGMMQDGTAAIPGLSTRLSGFDEVEEHGEGNGENWIGEGSERHDLTSRPELAGMPNQDLQEGEEWDSDSEDDLQIVLNDDRGMYSNFERGGEREFEEGSEDEDGEDLVIVAGGDHPIEDQEWGGEVQLPLDGAVSTSVDKALPGDKTGDDRGQTGKGNVGIANAGVPRVGYSGQNYHPHYSQYKYVRPGATAISGGIPSVSGGTQYQTRPPVSSGGVWGPGKGVPTTGRGDWISGGGRGPGQRSSHSGIGMPTWSSAPLGRGLQSGFEFTLPPNKTVFEIDIDSFEDKPWRLPGVDITDFFNFSLDEEGWKQYCRQLEQLRLEATMQSKIRVYESGRSEQEYDPDLPPELAAATGLHEAFGESTQHKLPDSGHSAMAGRGRGLGHGRAPIPTGRAIQVEGGVGERRPSVDFRRPRLHDSDAVIEIVLQEPSEGDTTDPLKVPESANDVNERGESEKDVLEIGGDQNQANAEYSLQTGNGESWERDIVSRNINSAGGMVTRAMHHGDGILPLPPGPPIQCHSGSGAGPGMYSARLLDMQHVGRRSQLMKPHKGFAQVGDEHSNGSIANQDVKENRADSRWKERAGDVMDRKQTPEIWRAVDSMERKPTPEIKCKRDVEEHTVDEMHADSRSDDESKPTSEVKVEDDTGDDRGSVQSMKRQKLSLQSELQTTAAGYSHHLKASKSGNSKAESGNSRGYSKDRGNSRDYSKDRGNSRDYPKVRGSGEEEVSEYRPQKKLGKEGKKLLYEEEAYLYQKDYLWDGRHGDEKNLRHPKGRDYPNHSRVKDDQNLQGDREEMYHRKVKEEKTGKHRERDDHTKFWQGKNEDIRSLREKEEDLRRRGTLVKEDGSHHRNRAQNTERDETEEHLHIRKVGEDDWRARLDKADPKQRERVEHPLDRQEIESDPYLRRKKDEELLRKERIDKEEISRDLREREDMGGEKHEKDDDYRRRRKEEDLRRRERSDKDQGMRDLRDREDMVREKHERDDSYLRRKEEDLRRRERSDKDQGIRDMREREDMHREKHERDDDYLRRKEEDMRRRERADKDEGLRDARERKDMSREKQERDDDHHFRRREEESRRRNMFDDSRARKQRDDSWRRREREDEHWRKPAFEETHGRREREEDKPLLVGRSRRHSEEKMWHGSDRDKGHSREEASISSIEKDRLKEKRRHEEQRGKVKDRVDDTGRSRHHERDDIYTRMDRLSYEERNSRLDRAHLRYDHSCSGHSGEEQKLYREKRTLEPIKSKNFDRNGSVSGLADDKVRHDQTATGKRRKTEDYYAMHHNKKALERGTEDQESGSVWVTRADRRTHSHAMPSDLSKRMHEQEAGDRHASKLMRVAADGSASEDEHLKRGRSKLERWTSQKEKDDMNLWDNDKQQKQSVNHEESLVTKEEQTKMDFNVAAGTKGKLGKEQTHSREEEDRAADQENEVASDDLVHVTDTKQADIDQSGNQPHCDTVAKLEKRRERFKQPISNERESQKKAESEILLENETDEVKQERPARKRRWGSN